MKVLLKIIISMLLCFFLISQGLSISQDKQKQNYSLLKGARLETQDGVKILYINGSNYEMGYQHGFLLKNEVHENMRAFLDFAKKTTSYEELLDIWNETEPYIPSCYIEELHGICDGADIDYNIAKATYMYVVFSDMHCCTYAAWSNATIDGNLYHVRSLDFSLIIQDPETGKYIQENSIIIVRKPDNGLMSISPSIAGSMNFYQGINEKQIAIGLQVCWSNDETLKGIPVIFKIQNILDTADTLEKAIDILTSNRTLGWNFIISDGKKNIGYIVEISSNNTYVGTHDDPVETMNPFWSIKEVVRRTNFFIDPLLASTQRFFYNPGGFLSFLTLFISKPFFLLWRKYISVSNEIEKNWGELDLNSSISVMRKVYSGKTDIFMFLFLKLGRHTVLCDFHQWSVCLKTGEFLISFADAERFAHDAQLHYFNIYDLFE